MSVNGKSPCESNFPDQKPGKNNEESRMNSYSSSSEFNKSSNIQVSWKLNLPNIQPNVSRKLPSVPSLTQTERQFLSSVPMNEISKVRQRPRRVLPRLPPIVQEILRWSIHPREVLRGAASVSHLWNLPTIKEEGLPSVQFTEKKLPPTVPSVKRILPSVPPMANRSLPSNQPNVACKPLPKFRAEFRKRMQPSLPTIKERVSPMLPKVELLDGSKESTENEASQEPGLKPAEITEGSSAGKLQSIIKRKKVKQRKRNKADQTLSRALAKERAQASCQGREDEELPSVYPKLNRRNPSLISADSCEWLDHKRDKTEEIPCLRAKLARRSKTLFQPSAKERSFRPPGMRPVLPSTSLTHEATIPKPPLTPKGPPSARPIVRRTHLSTVNRPLPSIPATQEPMVPKPPSTPKGPSSNRPIVKRAHAKIQALVNRPLPSIPSTKETVVPKPPSAPKGLSSARPIASRVPPNKNRQLPSSSTSQQSFLFQASILTKRIIVRQLLFNRQWNQIFSP